MQGHRSPGEDPNAAELAFGQVLRDARAVAGISQEELAFQSGYHPTYISQLERGKKSPSLRTLLSLSDALKTRASDLVRQVEEKSR